MRVLRKTLAVAATFVLPIIATPALAAGDGGAGDTPTCPKGQVYDQKSEACKDAARGAVDDDSLYDYGRMLAHDGRYGEAIAVLSLAADKADPRILNYLGYSHRKAGRVVVALGYYEEALRQDPDYTLAREYMGEAYLQKGDLAAARVQLVEIGRRAGTDSREYALLAGQIEAFSKG